jgi:hypothetical protein
MSDILIDNQSPPSTPSAGQTVIYSDTVSKLPAAKNDTGNVFTLGSIVKTSTANQTGFAADTYLTGSGIAIPSSLIKAQTVYRGVFDMVKTAAGTAAGTVIVRFGTAGTTADTARLTFTWGAGTAAIDTGVYELWVTFRNAGASCVAVGVCRLTHALAATGLTNTGASGSGALIVTSAAFDATVANSIVGVSYNGGASFSGTNVLQQFELLNV